MSFYQPKVTNWFSFEKETVWFESVSFPVKKIIPQAFLNCWTPLKIIPSVSKSSLKALFKLHLREKLSFCSTFQTKYVLNLKRQNIYRKESSNYWVKGMFTGRSKSTFKGVSNQFNSQNLKNKLQLFWFLKGSLFSFAQLGLWPARYNKERQIQPVDKQQSIIFYI